MNLSEVSVLWPILVWAATNIFFAGAMFRRQQQFEAVLKELKADHEKRMDNLEGDLDDHCGDNIRHTLDGPVERYKLDRIDRALAAIRGRRHGE